MVVPKKTIKTDPLYDIRDELVWRVNTVALLKETINNNSKMGGLAMPFKIFGILLAELGEVAAYINDPVLNGMMCRLAIYSQSDPYQPDYDNELTNRTIAKGERIKRERKAKKISV